MRNKVVVHYLDGHIIKGATLDFVVLETEAKDAAGKPVFYSRNILISKRM